MHDTGTKENLRVIIAGGGTGGHLYPGLAIAEALLERDAETVILFVGTKKGIETRVLPQEGYELSTLYVDKLMGGDFKRKIRALYQIPVAIMQSLWIIFKFRPNAVVGVGGYAAGPLVLMAYVLGVPSIIHEQNVCPGFTNRVLGKVVDLVAVSFASTIDLFPPGKTSITGNPLRKSFFDLPRAHRESSSTPTLFILGGSRGAKSINDAVIEALPLLSLWKERVKIIHQTGQEDYPRVTEAYSSTGLQAEVRPYFNDIARCYDEADLVLSRAGATTLAELMACGKASILVPYPFAVGNHQEVNALELKRLRAAEVLLDSELNGQILAGTVKKIIDDEERLKYMRTRFASLGRPDAARKVMELIYKLVPGGTTVKKKTMDPREGGTIPL